ncbi:deoxyribodipyrimidine photo-lyase [Ochrobactrum soli]|uniref:Deoxyribodipyrimidine photo-lyase n=1 Tax=Ochrobactrum soli TaxID=2448455 RepID=A0A849KU99_9HYPH|nr:MULTISPECIES: deoxyribodipyrimidine photo-lyase [Brucella]RRD22448.1 deoxyribodipyrimidine photo-lyase [Brucellaceae bacterium VT-16-1752]WHT44686.1 deoxyribodipyrimidine photo-lyase [Ochrobactrum sp. SSR]NNU61084.1 deoxyribodipyrimidine photo-lyase [[Ochrobactrum] soli]RLL64139.1 deoxyribodipyrimidine photo-lyase [[Ochrobactrum] soli]WHS29828.1 deoxyribodipyrimidine photo-lyase [Brucella sp. NM4]
MTAKALVWLRNDLRLADNPALHAAFKLGGAITVLFVHESNPQLRVPGAAVRWWLEQSLDLLAKSLNERNIELIVADGEALNIIEQLIEENSFDTVFWNRRYAPQEREVDAIIKSSFKDKGLRVESFAGNLLVEPWEIKSGNGGSYQVFTPYAKSLRQHGVSRPLPSPDRRVETTTVKHKPKQKNYKEAVWSRKMSGLWKIGETAAIDQLYHFFDTTIRDYAGDRDRPDVEGTSKLSPHLRFGEISPRQAWHATLSLMDHDQSTHAGGEKFLSELIWRDFHYHQLYYRPDIAENDMRDTLADIRWLNNPEAIDAWKTGKTGIPLIDAGMRQLWATGWMHNRVRMLVASVLSKNMQIDWREGEKWFWDTLVDADIASNPGSWQWVAGCGMDAAPYFRVFNPVLQGDKFDMYGVYVRKWVPEIAAIPDRWIHKPFAAPEQILREAGVVLGQTYPLPVFTAPKAN